MMHDKLSFKQLNTRDKLFLVFITIVGLYAIYTIATEWINKLQGVL